MGFFDLGYVGKCFSSYFLVIFLYFVRDVEFRVDSWCFYYSIVEMKGDGILGYKLRSELCDRF